MNLSDDPNCFGFFSTAYDCQRCSAAKRCKALFVSDGMDLVSGIVDGLIGDMAPGNYVTTDQISLLVDQLTTGPLGDTDRFAALKKAQEGLIKDI